jgi:hypothetical protein
VLRRPDLGIPAPKINERIAVKGSVFGDASEQRSEVLLGEPFDPVRSRSHGAIVGMICNLGPGMQ